ncbi:MAG: hypothetical protein JRK53_25805 [Deltaproteobacteria bacterium]|nr:hypothetical protein [Deltaproteobacteria bacterium]
MSVSRRLRERMKLAGWVLSMGVMFAVSFSPDRFIRDGALVDDEASYFSHAMTIGLDLDLDYSNEIATVFNCDKTIASHPIGAGLLAAPFVAFFGVVDRLTGHPVIEDRSRYANSWAFFGFVFSANFYLFLGILLYFDAMATIFRRLRLSHITVFVFSTGIVHYALYAFFMSHAFEFGALAFTVWSSTKLYFALKKNRGALAWHLVAALSVVLNILVRYNNLNVLILPLTLVTLACVFDSEGRKPGPRELAGLVPRQALFLALASVPAIIFFCPAYHQIFPTRDVLYCYEAAESGTNGFFDKVAAVFGLLPNLPV